MAKRFAFFHEELETAWPQSYYAQAMRELQTEFVMGISNETIDHRHGDGRMSGPWQLEDLWVPGAKNFGALNQTRFVEEVGKSSVLIGIGLPFT